MIDLYKPNLIKIKLEINGAPNITHTISLDGKYHAPNRIENEANNIEIIAIASINNIIDCFLNRDRFNSFLSKDIKIYKYLNYKLFELINVNLQNLN
jgi:hypothetical protein